MPRFIDPKLGRIIDANFNRAKEGLRVCEDICRFIDNNKVLTSQYKSIRHQLTQIISRLSLPGIVQARDIPGDVGKKSQAMEFKRKNVADIFYANSQRVKESIRVLEEFLKLIDKNLAQDLKQLRYQVYALEQKGAAKLRKS